MNADEVRAIRASEMDDLFECTPSVVGAGGVRVRSAAGAPAKLGKIIHSLAASFIESGKFDVNNECQRRGFDEQDEVSRLMYYVVQTWQDVGKFFRMPLCERVFKGPTLETPAGPCRVEGTLDVFSPVWKPVEGKAASEQAAAKSNRLIFADWKSGRVDGGYSNQMFAYAYLLWNWKGRPDDIDITGIVAFLQHRYQRVAKYDAASLKAWEYDLRHNALSRTDTYRPGGHCAECPIYHSCEAQQQMTRSAMTAIVLPAAIPPDDTAALATRKALDILASITPDNKNEPEVRDAVATFLHRRKVIQKAIDIGAEVLKAAVQRVGPIDTGDGYSAVVRDVEIETLDPVKAAPILKRHLSDAEVMGACRMSYPKIRAAVASKFGRGEKKSARERVEKDLEAAGAVTVATQQRLEELEIGNVEQSATEGTDALEGGAGCNALPAPADRERQVDGRRPGDEGA
jgi:hypothetical protein